MQFSSLDMDHNSALSYFEFAVFAGESKASERVFKAMDLDKNHFVTKVEISDAIHMLEAQTTVGTEDIPDENNLDSNNREEDVPGNLSMPITAHPTMDDQSSYGEDTHQFDGNTPESESTIPVPPPNSSVESTAPDTEGTTAYTASTPVASPGDSATPGPSIEIDKDNAEAAINVLSGTSIHCNVVYMYMYYTLCTSMKKEKLWYGHVC